MKTKQTINPNNNVELYIPTDLNHNGMFVITGDYDTVTDIATNYDVRDAPKATQKPRKAVIQSKAVQTALENSKAVVESLKAQIVMDAKVKVFDLLHGTNYAQVRKELLAEQRNRAFEQAIGLERK